MRSPDVQPDFNAFLASLNAAGVKYVVVGAYALAAHGVPRNTLDLDVLVQPTHANARRLIQALARFGFGNLAVRPEDFTAPDRILQLGRQPVRIDILTSITGVRWTDAWQGRVRGRYGGVPTQFLGRTELIANKRATGRAKDLGDVESLSAVRRPAASRRGRKRRRP